jgi:hypothetical protein
MLIDSITPYHRSNWSGVDHYAYTDGTGAQHRLEQNNGNVWSRSRRCTFWFDANAGVVLHAKDLARHLPHPVASGLVSSLKRIR